MHSYMISFIVEKGDFFININQSYRPECRNEAERRAITGPAAGFDEGRLGRA